MIHSTYYKRHRGRYRNNL